MTGNAAFDVVIGLVFVFTLYSLFTTTIVEAISQNFQFRARNLRNVIQRMLDDDKTQVIFSEKFFRQPMIKFMSSGWLKIFNKPSFIQPRNFSKTLVQVLKDDSLDVGGQVEKIHATLKKYEGTETGKMLITLFEEANYEVEKYKVVLEQWFNDMMEQATEWYKKWMVYVTFICGVLIATIFNVDCFQIAATLSKDSKAREEFVQLAGNLVNNSTFITPAFDTALRNNLLHDTILIQRFEGKTDLLRRFVDDSVYNKSIEARNVLIQRIDTLYTDSQKSQNILSIKRVNKNKLFFDSWLNFWGCFVTAIALTLGAPFWFDLLRKMLQLRSGSVFKQGSGKTDRGTTTNIDSDK